MFPGTDVLKSWVFLWGILFFSCPSFTPAQEKPQLALAEGRRVYAVVKDALGEKWETVLRFDAAEIAVRSQDNQEKRVPVKYLKSITLERVRNDFPGEELRKGVRYTVRLENTQEIFTLDKKYTFSLNTNLGLTTKSLDPDLINSLAGKDSLPGPRLEDGALIQDKTIIFSLEIKF